MRVAEAHSAIHYRLPPPQSAKQTRFPPSRLQERLLPETRFRPPAKEWNGRSYASETSRPAACAARTDQLCTKEIAGRVLPAENDW